MPGPRPESTVRSRLAGQLLVLAVLPAEVYQADTIESLGHDLRGAIEGAPKAAGCIIDLSGVTFLSSAALGLILNLNAQMGGRGLKFALAGAAGEVAEVFKRSRLEKAITLYATVAEALGKLQCP
jgi:anti-anti-sigma factor